MTAWETALTTRDTNRVVRPLEWGFDWLKDFAAPSPDPSVTGSCPEPLDRMIALNEEIVRRSDDFFAYTTPTDFHLEFRHPELFPTNVRPETLEQEAEMKRRAAAGEMEEAEFLRFTSPVRTPYPENDQVNARWYPAPSLRDPKERSPRPK
jgi:hypothetical protein